MCSSRWAGRDQLGPFLTVASYGQTSVIFRGLQEFFAHTCSHFVTEPETDTICRKMGHCQNASFLRLISAKTAASLASGIPNAALTFGKCARKNGFVANSSDSTEGTVGVFD